MSAKFFWDSYDYLGRFFILNVILFLIGGIIFLFFYSVGKPIYYAMEGHRLRQLFTLLSYLIFFTFVYGGFSLSGIIHFAGKISNESDPVFKDILSGYKKYGLKSALLGFVIALIEVILLLNIIFYASGRFIPPSYKIFTIILAGVCFWGVIFTAALSLYAFPYLITQEAGIIKTLKYAAVLTIDNVFFIFYALGILIIIIFLSYMTKGIGAAFFMIFSTGTLLNSLMSTTALKYKFRDEEKARENEPSDSKQEAKFTSWKDKKNGVSVFEKEEKFDRYKRGFRDILKPWE